jgi:hypothetical protein
MTQTMTQRPTAAARRLGYGVGAVVNVALLYAVNIWPGWEVVPFLTAETASVLVLVNLSIISNLTANAVYLVYDAAWLKSLGTVLTTTVGMITLVRIWQVFPFDFGDSSFNWQLVTRILLIIGIVGSDIGIIVAFIAFVKNVVARNS